MMTKEQFSRETDYGVKVHIARKMLSQGLISEREFRQLCTKFERRCRPMIGGFIPEEKRKFT
jgi:hypothetical protein